MGVLTCKWGFDGASGQSEYKQKFKDFESDANLFCVTLVPLDLSFGVVSVWRNERPSSTRFCRPLMLLFAKESYDLLRSVKEKWEAQISQLESLTVQMNEGSESLFELKCDFKMVLSMIDGKASNAITGTTSSQSCSICGATPIYMKNTRW